MPQTNPQTNRATHFSPFPGRYWNVGVPIRRGGESIADYSPFGVLPIAIGMDGRTVSGDSYRYGYQGSEKDDETKGAGNSYTTFFRQLDPRVGRWFSVDPVFQPWQSPYCSMDGNPVSLNDILGNKADDYEKRLKRKEKKLDKKSEKIKEREFKLATKYVEKNGGEIVEKVENIPYSDDKSVRYYVGGNEGIVAFQSTYKSYRSLDKQVDINDTKLYGKYYTKGEVMGYQLSLQYSWVFVAGASYSVDYTFVGDTYCFGNTVGGGMGFELGVSGDCKMIVCEESGRYNAKKCQNGQGFSFNLGYGPFCYSRSGDISSPQFAWNGESNTSHGGLPSTMYELSPKKFLSPKNYARFSSLAKNMLINNLKPKIGGSYQWTQSFAW